MKLNKALGTLEITGTAEGLELARIKVAEVTGPLKQLSPAVWSELMRTRKQEGPGRRELKPGSVKRRVSSSNEDVLAT